MNPRDTRHPRSARRSNATAETANRKARPVAEWRLPSGQSLVEYALQSGLLARRAAEPVRKPARRRGNAKS